MTITFDTPQSLCRLGVARCDVTPPVGIYHRMWGAATHDRSTGVHRPLTATAAVFSPFDATHEAEPQVLIVVDHCLLWSGDMTRLLDAIAAGGGIASEQIIVAFSHTHAAGLMDSERRDLPGGEMIPPYLDELGHKLGEAVREAVGSLKPVTIVYGEGNCTLAAHRDLWDPESNQFVCGFHPDGPADSTVVVARATDESGATLATFVNYACHPTTLAWDNTLISPDYPGAMREVVEQATGAPCLFIQGASGDLGPREGFVGDPAVADRNGRQLGYAALSALVALPAPRVRFEYQGPVISGATIGVWSPEPLKEADLEAAKFYERRRWTVPLPYRPDRRDAGELEAEQQRWQAAESDARQRGDERAAVDARAMVERMTRALTRARALPPGDEFPYPVTCWRIGPAVWLWVEGEPYQLLQTELRARFPNTPLIVGVLANGSRCFYLPTRETYGKQIYQETAAVLAPGCLETLIGAAGERITDSLPG